ncbi:hypothetical protein [Ruegeria sp.]|uniref:hypothetical protein n=1 Tax=Ruegeria sp. TaxID=1879320 RepID=UPI003C7BC32A
MTKFLPLIFIPFACIGCADIPELEGSEAASLRQAPYPRLIPLDDTLGTPIDPISEAETVEDDLIARSDALAQKAEALQNAPSN